MAKAFQTNAFQADAFQLLRRLYATVGGAYRTFKEVTKPYRKFKQGGDYRRFKE